MNQNFILLKRYKNQFLQFNIVSKHQRKLLFRHNCAFVKIGQWFDLQNIPAT